MVRVRAVRWSDGRLAALFADGHAPSGHLACAAASRSLREFGIALAGRSGLALDGTAPVPGEYRLRVVSADDSAAAWLRAETETFLDGLLALAREYPDAVTMTIEIQEQETQHGS